MYRFVLGGLVTISFQRNGLGYLYVTIAAVIWGSNGVIVNFVPLPANAIAFFRVLFASLTLLPLVVATRRIELMIVAKSWNRMLTLGALLSFGWAFLFQSMKLIPIANAVLLNYMAPVFVALLAPILLKERLERITLIALATSVVGIALISYQQSTQITNWNVVGVMFGLLAGFAYASFTLFAKMVMTNSSSLTVAFYAYSLTSLFLSPSLIDVNLTMNVTSWFLLLLLGIFNTGFAVTFYLKGLKRIAAQKAVIFTYFEPVGAVLFGSLFLAQYPTILTVVGGFLILFSGYSVASQ